MCFLTEKDKRNLVNYVRAETLKPCYKQRGIKDAQPRYNRPTYLEVRGLAQLTELSGAELGLKIGVDGRTIRSWQSAAGKSPTYSEWILICKLASNSLEKSSSNVLKT